MECNVSELVKRGHDKAAQLKSSGGAVSQLISDLATHLDVQLARSNALAAENAGARNAVQVFCDVVGANTDAICEEVGQDGVRAILAAMSATGNMPATDAFLAEVRAQAHKEGAHFVANRMLAAWDAGFIDDTAKNAADIARMILTSTEFMAGAPVDDFDRSFADGVLEDIAAQLRKGVQS
ncbi:Uncharacterised protein [Enterobacter hormaechei]|uniref:hypothetical protein n=1 Tax=Enterobacter hormaechei TaxID=158836 RepID=UPI00079BCFE5|nr:hypothetical protein [Enterobacter hormaechei]SAG70208.1 Uncharacterised protein [Enterobacter hormaechei]